MNMKPYMSAEMCLVHDRCTEWHHDELRDAQRLDEAWSWLCESRKAAPTSADIRDLR